jgi:hypothetical protein
MAAIFSWGYLLFFAMGFATTGPYIIVLGRSVGLHSTSITSHIPVATINQPANQPTKPYDHCEL